MQKRAMIMAPELMQDAALPLVPGVSKRLARLPIAAIGCAAAVLAGILVAHPYAEIGIGDEFSYIRIAQLLARTGHIVYTGWATPILGWQLYLAALFIKLFGFSFTTVRASIAFVSVLTAFLCQRTFVRSGINEWNAGIATLTVFLSPLCMPSEVTFMTDIPGLFAIILCFYACLRAIQARTPRAAIAWIGFAALSDAVFGSSRQIAWLGALVLVPSAVWILRRRRSVVIAGAGFWMLSSSLIFAIDRWFRAQPYTQFEALVPGHIGPHAILQASAQMLRAFLDVVLVLLPVLVVFLPALRERSRPWQVYAAAFLFVISGFYLWRTHSLELWYAPFLWGASPFLNLPSARPVFTVAVVLCILAVLSAVLPRKKGPRFSLAELRAAQDKSPDDQTWLSNRTFAVLVLPFTAAYLCLLLPRAGFFGLWDRYVLPLMFLSLLFLLRFYQQQFRRHLPVAALLLSLCAGAYAVASLHDIFAERRASLAAINEVLAKGVPATSITGGWDYDGWTELQFGTHINAPRMHSPQGASVPVSTHYGLEHCVWWYCDMYPHVVPRYAISTKPDVTLEGTFAPVPYRPWVDRAGAVYVVRFPQR